MTTSNPCETERDYQRKGSQNQCGPHTSIKGTVRGVIKQAVKGEVWMGDKILSLE